MPGQGIRTTSTLVLATLVVLVSAEAMAAQTTSGVYSRDSLAELVARGERAFDEWQDSMSWRTVTAEELAMTGEPRAPGAAAVYLYTETSRNNFVNGEMTYWQAKILAEEGRNLANIGIRHAPQDERIRRIDARVIQPDGSIVPFTGEFYDRPLQASGQSPTRLKAFTLPDVRVGSVIEVRYWRAFIPTSRSGTVFVAGPDGSPLELDRSNATPTAPPRWILSQQLFTRHAVYSLQLLDRQFASWSLPTILPAGMPQPRVEANNLVKLEARNMPAFVTEDYMPPAQDLVLSVDFSYDRGEAGDISDPPKYWKTFGELHSQSIEEFLGNPRYVKRRLDRILARGDSTEQKYRKIYEHVRGMANLDIPGAMDEAARKKCSRVHQHAWDVAEARCGNTAELQLYFIALCRAADLPAVPVRLASRHDRIFSPETPDASRLNAWIVAVTIEGREILLSPAFPFLPFGSLIWWDTAVPGLRIDEKGGTWSTTPMPVPADALTRRTAKLVLTEDGVLEGTVVVRHTGHEATVRVIALLEADEQTRIDVLKQDLLAHLAVPAEVSVARQPDWRATDGGLEIEYRIKVQQWAVTSGDRLMVGVGLFGNEQVGKFIAAKREHPIYFRFPFTVDDDLEIALPSGYKLQSSPARQVSPDAALKYSTSVDSREGSISIRRSLTHNLLLAKQNQYPRVKAFYELVRSGDQEQVVLAR